MNRLKNVVALLLLMALTITMTGCGGNGGDSGDETGKYKIGIVTGTVSQGEDEYRAAELMVERYGDRVVHVTYPDNFMQEQETYIGRVTELAADPDIKAILICQAVPGTAAALDKVREMRDDILLLIGVIHEDPQVLAEKADIVVDRDEVERGRTIPEIAKQMGATKFIHYSFPRHLSIPLLSQRRDRFKEECERLGMEFIEVSAPDPMGPDGIPGTQRFILEDVPLQVQTRGKDIAVFGTNLSMQEPLIEAALQAGCLFPEPCSPGPTMGYPGALGIDVKGMEGDMKAIMDAIEKEIVAKGGAGRFATWPVALNMTIIQALTELAIQSIDGGDADFSDLDTLKAQLEKEADNEMMVRRLIEGANYYVVISGSYIFGADN
ncbi:MAG: DUF3798 domain-containing protein [Bacillota bacterium]|jgi:hypothetical protein